MVDSMIFTQLVFDDMMSAVGLMFDSVTSRSVTFQVQSQVWQPVQVGWTRVGSQVKTQMLSGDYYD